MNSVAVQLTHPAPISSVQLRSLSESKDPASPQPAACVPEQVNKEKANLIQTAEALRQAVSQVQTWSQAQIADHRDQIIRLSLQIAGRVLAHEIRKHNYEIEKILAEALQEVPSGQSVTIRLNPEDFEQYKKTVTEKQTDPLSEHLMAPDWSVSPAQCIVETEEGIIEWLIDEQLERISEALLGQQPL